MDMNRFETLVTQAVDDIPDPFVQYIQNVVFMVELWPDEEILDADSFFNLPSGDGEEQPG